MLGPLAAVEWESLGETGFAMGMFSFWYTLSLNECYVCSQVWSDLGITLSKPGMHGNSEQPLCWACIRAKVDTGHAWVSYLVCQTV